MEDVKGYKQQDAYDALKALNLSPKIQAVADDDTAVGYVVKTDRRQALPFLPALRSQSTSAPARLRKAP